MPVTMPFNADSDRKLQTPRWLSYGLALAFLAGAYWVASALFGRAIGLVMCVPVIGVYVSRLLLNHAGDGFRAMRWLKLHKLNGKYHAFDDLHVRIEWEDGQVQVSAQDVFRLLHENPEASTLRRLAISFGESGFFQDENGGWWFGETAILEWLNKRAQKHDQKALRLKLWLERDVIPPHRKKAEIRSQTLSSPK